MTQPAKGSLDDSLKKSVINDFSGGINVYKGALDLAQNESPGMLNVIPFPGRLQYRGGWIPYSTLPHVADQAYAFYDSDGAKHFPVWEDGNLIDVVSGTPVTVATAVYTAGQQVGVVDDNGILYWSTETVPLQFWDPVGGTHGPVVQDGVSPPPASPILLIYTGAIVACGVKFGASAFQPNVFAWSAINDPANWNAANSQAVGPNNGGSIAFGIVLGIAEIGVSPFRSFVVGRSDKGIYGYMGALGSLEEFLVNCPVGCIDGRSAQYIPGADNFGAIVFLGTDAQFWKTNGITANVISLNILPLLAAAVPGAITSNPNVHFWSGYNSTNQYYYCDINGIQYVFKWDTGGWAQFQGWPTGPVFNSTDAVGRPTQFIATSTGNNPLVGEVGLAGQLDNGSPPNVYWTSAYLHMGDPEQLKEFHWIAPFFYATGTNYTVNGTSLPRANGSFLASGTLTFMTPQIGNPTPANLFILDQSLLNGPDVLSGGQPSVVGTGTPLINHGRLSCPATIPADSILQGLPGLTELLRGGAAQFTIAYAGGMIDYELIGLEVRYIERGYMRDGGQMFNPEGGITPSFNIYVPPLT